MRMMMVARANVRLFVLINIVLFCTKHSHQLNYMEHDVSIDTDINGTKIAPKDLIKPETVSYLKSQPFWLNNVLQLHLKQIDIVPDYLKEFVQRHSPPLTNAVLKHRGKGSINEQGINTHSITARDWSPIDKNLTYSINGPLTFLSVLNGDKHQRDKTRYQRTGATNELKNKEILDEARRWNIDVLQLRGIKVSKRSLTRTGLFTTTTRSLKPEPPLRSYDKPFSHRHDSLLTVGDKINEHTRNGFHDGMLTEIKTDNLYTDAITNNFDKKGTNWGQRSKGVIKTKSYLLKYADQKELDINNRALALEKNHKRDINSYIIDAIDIRNKVSTLEKRYKRDTQSVETKRIEGQTKRVEGQTHLVEQTKRVPSLEEVYKRLTTLDVVFYMPLNMSMNSSDSNDTSDGRVKCMALLNDLFKGVKDDGKQYCNSTWDEVSCWPRTLAGTIASVPCPGYLTGINDSNNATKLCYENGTWADKAAYDFCLGSEVIKSKPEGDHSTAIRIIYHVGFTVSTLTLAIALFILLYFRSLRCLRNLIHCHLIVTFIVSNITWIIMNHSLSYMQSPGMAWLCKTTVTIYSFSHATNFFWMFVEGLYLHIIIVWTYSADRIKLRYLVVIGWGLPAINVVIWIILRLKYTEDHCWLPNVDDISDYDWAMIGPILLVLLANIIFLSTIIWVLITKLRASHTLEIRQYRKAVRATVILFPLLGITYVLFITPPSDHPRVKIVFLYINAILQSFQGLLVAIFYCFLNGEVKTVLKKKFSRYADARNLSTKYTKTSVVGYSTTYGNGAIEKKRSLNGSNSNNQQPESIPLTDTTMAAEINES